MKRVSGKDLARVLRKKGWVRVRTKGAHHRYEKQGFPPVTVPHASWVLESVLK